MTWDMTAAGRRRERERIASACLADARRKAARSGLSIKCGDYGNHAPTGCQNDGSNCLCECHDPASGGDR